FAERIGQVLSRDLPPVLPVVEAPTAQVPGALLDTSVRRSLQQGMDEGAGVLRSAGSLAQVRTLLAALPDAAPGRPCTEDWETSNLHAIASVLAQHAVIRQETRGSHWREDYPDRDDEHWRVRLVTQVDADGLASTQRRPVDAMGRES
ncbi:MAG: hypothetical protein ACKOW5_15820, partial [Actinomycetales bacterium]